MKPLLIIPLMMLSGWALAEEPNPFMSAEDRQQHIEQKKKKEEEKLQKMVADAVKEIKAEMAKQQAAQETALSTEGVSEGGGRHASAAQRQSATAAFPSDFAIAGIKGNHILMRQMDNKSMIVTSGEIFWDKGQAYEAEIVGNESVSILRVSDGEVVFYGGVGSVFTPTAGASSEAAVPSYRDNGGV